MRGVSLQHEVVRSIIDNSSFDELRAFSVYLSCKQEYLEKELNQKVLEYINELTQEPTENDIFAKQADAYRVLIYLKSDVVLFICFYEDKHTLQVNLKRDVIMTVAIGQEDKDPDIRHCDKIVQDVLEAWLPLVRKISDKRKELGRRGGVA